MTGETRVDTAKRAAKGATAKASEEDMVAHPTEVTAMTARPAPAALLEMEAAVERGGSARWDPKIESIST